MSERDWLGLVRAGMPPFWKLTAESCGGSTWERDGVLASIIPAAPSRSVFNSVFYEDGAALIAQLDELRRTYEEAGVRAWTVWVPEGERELAEALSGAGHLLDANPRAMAMATSELRPTERDPALTIREQVDMARLARLNEIAYGYPPGDFSPVASSELPGFHLYFGDLDGETVGAAGIWDHGADGVLAWVATLPEARGRGVSTALCAHAVAEARERGIETTTLQATKLGAPIYLRIGYRDYGALQMWERRKPG